MIKRLTACALALLAMLAVNAGAETDGDCAYTLLGPDGGVLTRRGGHIYEGDEYIAGDDSWYRVVSVDDAGMTATAECLGKAELDMAAFAAFSSVSLTSVLRVT